MKTKKEKIIRAGVILIGVLFIFSMISSAFLYSNDSKQNDLPEETLLDQPLNNIQKNLLFNRGGSLITITYPNNCDSNCLFAKQTIMSIKDNYAPFVYLYEQEGDYLEISLECFGLIENYNSINDIVQKQMQNHICNNLLGLWQNTETGKKCLMQKALEEYE